MMSIKNDTTGLDYDNSNDSCWGCCSGAAMVFLAAVCITILALSAKYQPIPSCAAGAVNAYCTQASNSLRRPTTAMKSGRAASAGITSTARSLPAASSLVNAAATAELTAYILNRNKQACAPYIAKLIYDNFGDDAMLFTIIAWRESRFNLTATGDAGEVGLFQLHPKYHKATMKKLGLDIHNVEDQAKYAKILWDKSGGKPWSTYRDAKAELKARRK